MVWSLFNESGYKGRRQMGEFGCLYNLLTKTVIVHIETLEHNASISSRPLNRPSYVRLGLIDRAGLWVVDKYMEKSGVYC
jgi:hypothetical protein